MIDIIICTYNEPTMIKRCVNSILKQTFNEKFKILLVDGGSDKKTLQAIKELQKKDSRIKFLKNPAKLPEGEGKGKWLAFRKTNGEIFGIIDQDNELIGKDSLRKIISPFKDKNITGVACKLFLEKKDNLVNQCIALIGTDPFLSYRSLDGISPKIKKEDCMDYETFEQKKDFLIVTGGNCFFYRRSDLEKIGGYNQDIDNIYKLTKIGKNRIAIPKDVYTHHYAIKGFWDFIKKKKKWGRTYSQEKREFSWMPKTKLERKEFLVNIYNISTIFPLLLEAYVMILRTKKWQWAFIPVMKIVTTLAYITSRRYL